jgi:hypothetical protein
MSSSFDLIKHFPSPRADLSLLPQALDRFKNRRFKGNDSLERLSSFGGFENPKVETFYNKTVFAMLFLLQKALLRFMAGGKSALLPDFEKRLVPRTTSCQLSRRFI